MLKKTIVSWNCNYISSSFLKFSLCEWMLFSIQFLVTCYTGESNPEQKRPNLHKRNHLLAILNAKTNPTCPSKGVACKFQRTIDHGDRRQSNSLPVKIQIANCCCLHEQAIQSILITPTHPNSQKISKKQEEIWRIQGKRQLGSWQPCHEVAFSHQTLIFYTSSNSNVLPILNCYSGKKVLQSEELLAKHVNAKFHLHY